MTKANNLTATDVLKANDRLSELMKPIADVFEKHQEMVLAPILERTKSLLLNRRN